MKTITKATIKRLETEDFGKFTRISTALEHIAKAACSEENKHQCQRAYFVEDELIGNYIVACVDSYIKPDFNGLSTRFPQLVETTFTHGNNQVTIRDINKLVKLLLKK